MKRRFHHYSLWEDWQAGLYRRERPDPDRIAAAGNVLADVTGFRDTATLVTVEWRHATEHNLTDLSQNRRAWLGQAAAAYQVGASQTETCIAWNRALTDGERNAANRVADAVINGWCSNAFQLEMVYA